MLPALLLPIVLVGAGLGSAPAIAKTAQAIAFGPLAGKSFGASPFAVSASASSGLAVSFASRTTSICTIRGSTVTLVAAGTCTLRASQGGNGTYAAAPNVDQSFAVAKANQTISFAPLADRIYGTAAFGIAASASSGLAVSFASLTKPVCTVGGGKVTLVAAGTCTIQAAQPGNANYSAAPTVAQRFTITTAGKTGQAIAFGVLPDRAIGSSPFALSASASSGLSVNFTSLTPSICAVNGSMLALATAGRCIVRATQAGNGAFAPAPTIDRSFLVSAPGQLAYTYDGVGNITGIQRTP